MTKMIQSGKMPKQFYIKGKDEIKDVDAPVISDEFIDHQPEGDYEGQTIGVKSDTKLEEDLGVGAVKILRTFEFGTNPHVFDKGLPDGQTMFEAHRKLIAGLLWQDGMTPIIELDPKIILSSDKSKYLIMVWAKPSIGQVLVEQTKTLSEIVHNERSKQNPDKVQRSVPIPPIKKKKASRTVKTSK